jgi:hypothetical protein
VQERAKKKGADDAEPACAANIVAARPAVHAGLGNKDLDRKVRCVHWGGCVQWVRQLGAQLGAQLATWLRTRRVACCLTVG